MMYVLSDREAVLQTLPITDERPHLSVCLFLSFSIASLKTTLYEEQSINALGAWAVAYQISGNFFYWQTQRVDSSLKNLDALHDEVMKDTDEKRRDVSTALFILSYK